MLAALLLTVAAGPASAFAPAAGSKAAVPAGSKGHSLFSCRLPGGKIASVTHSGGRFVYRYGTAARAELTIAGTATSGNLFQLMPTHGGATEVQLRFVKDGYSYIVHSFPRDDIVDNDPTSGLVVYRARKEILNRTCSPWAEISFDKMTVEDYEALTALPEILSGAPSAWGLFDAE